MKTILLAIPLAAFLCVGCTHNSAYHSRCDVEGEWMLTRSIVIDMSPSGTIMHTNAPTSDTYMTIRNRYISQVSGGEVDFSSPYRLISNHDGLRGLKKRGYDRRAGTVPSTDYCVFVCLADELHMALSDEFLNPWQNVTTYIYSRIPDGEPCEQPLSPR